MKIYITDQDYSRMVINLCTQLLPIKDKFEWIVGIERGGLPISSYLSYALNKKHTSINISFYGDGDKPTDEVKSSLIWKDHFNTLFYEGVSFLLVDDIVDSGRTIKFFKHITGITQNNKPTYWIATLHWCKENSPDCKPDFYVEEKNINDWIVYPWEPRE